MTLTIDDLGERRRRWIRESFHRDRRQHLHRTADFADRALCDHRGPLEVTTNGVCVACYSIAEVMAERAVMR